MQSLEVFSDNSKGNNLATHRRSGAIPVRNFTATFEKPMRVRYLVWEADANNYDDQLNACLYLDDEKVACTVDVSKIHSEINFQTS